MDLAAARPRGEAAAVETFAVLLDHLDHLRREACVLAQQFRAEPRVLAELGEVVTAPDPGLLAQLRWQA